MNLKKYKIKSVLLLNLLIFVIALALFYGNIPGTQRLYNKVNWQTYDWLLNYNYKEIPDEHSLVTVVDIDTSSILKYGPWRWPKTLVVKMLQELKKDDALMVVFDIVFGSEEKNIVLEQIKYSLKNSPQVKDEYLSWLVKEFDGEKAFKTELSDGEYIMGFYLHNKSELGNEGVLPEALSIKNSSDIDITKLAISHGEEYQSNYKSYAKSVSTGGFVSAKADLDGVIRKIPLLMNLDGKLYPSISLKAVMNYFMAENLTLLTKKNKDHLSLLGIDMFGKKILTNVKGEIYIPFNGAEYIPVISAKDLLEGKADRKLIDNQLIIIGSSAAMLKDHHQTPMHANYPGLLMQANIINHLLSNKLIHRPHGINWLELAAFILIGIIMSFSFSFRGFYFSVISLLLVSSTLIGLMQLSFEKYHAYLLLSPAILSIAIMFLVCMSYRYFLIFKQKRYFRGVLAKYIPPDVVTQLIKENSLDFLEPKNQEITMLFADIRSFTTMSEKFTSKKIALFLNKFLTVMTKIIFDNHGTIDKFIGDCIVAIWNAPLLLKDHSDHAIAASLLMIQALEKLNKSSKDFNNVQIGIGLNKGTATIGNIGSEHRQSYTMIGDEVNYAARLEGLTKKYGVTILVGSNMVSHSSKYLFIRVDKVRVVGRNQAGYIFSVIELKSKVSTADKNLYKLYHLAMNYYFKGDFLKAKEIMTEALALDPQNKLFLFHIKRIEELILNPPIEKWDGIYNWQSK